MTVHAGIPAFLDRRPAKPLVFTFSILNAYLNCPEAMQRRYIKKDLGPYVETPEIAWGNKVHKAFELRVGSGKPLPAEMEQWECFALPFDRKNAVTEQQIGIDNTGKASPYWDAPVWFRGKVDVILTEKNTAFLVDWKTGKSNYEHPFELQTNAVLAKAKFPHLTNIFGSYTWLKENRMGQVYDLSDTDATLTRMREIAANIEADRAADAWHKKQSGLCGYCPVRDCPHNRKSI
jgi:hypothetical protein